MNISELYPCYRLSVNKKSEFASVNKHTLRFNWTHERTWFFGQIWNNRLWYTQTTVWVGLFNFSYRKHNSIYSSSRVRNVPWWKKSRVTCVPYATVLRGQRIENEPPRGGYENTRILNVGSSFQCFSPRLTKKLHGRQRTVTATSSFSHQCFNKQRHELVMNLSVTLLLRFKTNSWMIYSTSDFVI